MIENRFENETFLEVLPRISEENLDLNANFQVNYSHESMTSVLSHINSQHLFKELRHELQHKDNTIDVI